MEAMTETVAKIIDTNRALVADGTMTEEAAKARSIKQLTAMTYSKGNYFYLTNEKGVFIAHPDPTVVGKDYTGQVDANGFNWTADVMPRAMRDGVASVEYLAKRLGSATPAPKLSVYRYYAPWHWVIVTGTYIDDLIDTFRSTAVMLAVVAAGMLLLLTGGATLIIRSIARPTRALSLAMRELAAGKMDAVVPNGGSLAETRAMADSVQVFKDAAIDKSRLESEDGGPEPGRRGPPGPV